MSEVTKSPTEVRITNVRLSYPALFKATRYQDKPDQPLKFRASFIIPKDHPDLPKVKAAIKLLAQTKWPKKWEKVLENIKFIPNKFCLQDGDRKENDYSQGAMILTSGATSRPRVVDRDAKTPLVEADGRPYAGCYVNAVVDFFGYENGGEGISCGLKGVMFVKDGDSFGGGTPMAEDAFDDLADKGDDEVDPLG